MSELLKYQLIKDLDSFTDLVCHELLMTLKVQIPLNWQEYRAHFSKPSCLVEVCRWTKRDLSHSSSNNCPSWSQGTSANFALFMTKSQSKSEIQAELNVLSPSIKRICFAKLHDGLIIRENFIQNKTTFWDVSECYRA